MRAFVRGVRDLLRGLFGFPDRGRHAPNAAAAIEDRYRRPTRCC